MAIQPTGANRSNSQISSVWNWAKPLLSPIAAGLIAWGIQVRFTSAPEWLGGVVLWVGLIVGLIWLAHLLAKEWPAWRLGKLGWLSCLVSCVMGVALWPLTLATHEARDQHAIAFDQVVFRFRDDEGEKLPVVDVLIRNTSTNPIEMEIGRFAVQFGGKPVFPGQQLGRVLLAAGEDKELSINIRKPLSSLPTTAIVSVFIRYGQPGSDLDLWAKEVDVCHIKDDAPVHKCTLEIFQ